MECFEMIKPMVVGLCSIEGCCHSVWVWHLRALAQLREVKCLQGYSYILKNDI